MIVASMEAVEAGTFGGEVLYGTLQNGTLSAGKISDLVPAEVQEKYNAYIQQPIAAVFLMLSPFHHRFLQMHELHTGVHGLVADWGYLDLRCGVLWLCGLYRRGNIGRRASHMRA